MSGKSKYESKQYVLELAKNRQWESAGGRVQDVAAMDTSHIRNCIRWVERNDVPAGDVLIAMFEHELELRGADVPANMELEDKFRRLCAIVRDLLGYYKEHEGAFYAYRYEQMLDAIGVDVR